MRTSVGSGCSTVKSGSGARGISSSAKSIWSDVGVSKTGGSPNGSPLNSGIVSPSARLLLSSGEADKSAFSPLSSSWLYNSIISSSSSGWLFVKGLLTFEVAKSSTPSSKPLSKSSISDEDENRFGISNVKLVGEA